MGGIDIVLPSYHDYLISIGLSATTVADYRREVDRTVGWFAARGWTLRDATPGQLVEYASTRPNTPGVRAHIRSAVCHYWDWQEVQGWPGAIAVPTPAPMVCKALEPDEAARLVDVARGWWRPGAAVIVALGMGLRNQGIRQMRWDGFDDHFEWYTLVEKGNRQRTVAVPELVASELDGRRNGTPWVFEGRRGGHVSHETINGWVKQVGRQAGFATDEVWPHRMRHTFGAEALDNTGDLDAVREAMGHVRADTTRGYTRTTRRRLREVSDSLSYM